MSPTVHCSGYDDLDPALAYRLWALRSQVFVVEQDCVYLDLDGRDLEPDTLQVWIEEDEVPLACLRLLQQGDGNRKIGRVTTAPAHRGRGLAAALMRKALECVGDATCELDAQSHLEGWYEQFGFRRSGPDFMEDGIPHTPMRNR